MTDAERSAQWKLTVLDAGEPDLQHQEDWKLTPQERFASVYQLLEAWYPNGNIATGPPRVLEIVDRGAR